jgi:hypothetical protein
MGTMLKRDRRCVVRMAQEGGCLTPCRQGGFEWRIDVEEGRARVRRVNLICQDAKCMI